MSRRHQRKQEIARMLGKVGRQRSELAADVRQWQECTAPLDRGWNTLIGLRKYAVAGAAILVVCNIRQPGRLIHWARCAYVAWNSWKLFRRILPSR